MSKLKTFSKWNAVILVLSITISSCNSNGDDLSVINNMNFNEYFNKIKYFDFMYKMRDINYFGPTRGAGRLEISYLDGTEASFYPDNYENVNIFRKGSDGKNSKEKIISDIHKLIDIYVKYRLKSITVDLKDSIIDIGFNLDAIKKESLPEYQHPRKITDKFHFNEGVLIYTYGINFEKTQTYENLKYTKIEDRWYLAYY